MLNFHTHFLEAFQRVKETYVRGKRWIGYDGLLNMETFALMLMLLLIFLPVKCAIILTTLLAFLKTYIDVKNGHKNEMHDLICASLGIILGGIIVIAMII